MRHWAQRAQMALDTIDRAAMPRRSKDAIALEMAIEDVRIILCRLAGAATKSIEVDEPPLDLEDIT